VLENELVEIKIKNIDRERLQTDNRVLVVWTFDFGTFCTNANLDCHPNYFRCIPESEDCSYTGVLLEVA
jgi:hypothetical protein